MIVLGLSVLTGLSSPAEAVITIRSATVVNGVAVVEGGNAARAAPIFWEGERVTQANNGGNFAFQGMVPADCVGSLHEGDPAAAINVALANCGPVSDAPAPVPQTGQTTSYAPGDDGAIQAGVPFPSPRFTNHGNGTVTDNLTGLIWLQKANCFTLPQLWADALQLANILASPNCGLSDDSVAGDWRLPNVRELESLVDFRFSNPTLSNAAGTGPWAEGNAFSDVRSSKYWSSTSVVNNPARAWAVNLDGRYVVEDGKDSFGANFVWPVRGPE